MINKLSQTLSMKNSFINKLVLSYEKKIHTLNDLETGVKDNQMNTVKVVKAKSNLPKTFSSWLDYWEQKSGQRTNLCIEKLCTCNEVVGVHVEVPNSNETFVVPLCIKHSKTKSELEIVKAYELIPIK